MGQLIKNLCCWCDICNLIVSSASSFWDFRIPPFIKIGLVRAAWRRCKWKWKVKVTWHVAKYGNPYSELVLCIYPIQSAHTHSSEHTHTVNTHPEQWAAIYAAAPGEQLGVRCLAQGHLSRGIEGEESAVHSLPPTYNSCRTWDSNSQPLDYESDYLTIRARLPHKYGSQVKRLSSKGSLF